MIFEVCCGCTEDAINAYKGGADRIELNSSLFLGGLTPSVGTLRLVKKETDFPVMCMVRPREGGFCYSDTEYETMKEDAKLLLENGADGLVFGFLHGDGTIDVERTKEFIALCGDKEKVFHRAIDVTPDLIEATKLLSSLGITRVLTSGGKPTVMEGAEVIKEMLAVAGDMQILPGGSIRQNNVEEIVEKTGVNQVHASMRKLHYDTSTRLRPEIFFGGMIDGKFIPEDEVKITDPVQVAAMKVTLDSIK